MEKYIREFKRHRSQMRKYHVYSKEVSKERRKRMVKNLSIKRMAENSPEVIKQFSSQSKEI